MKVCITTKVGLILLGSITLSAVFTRSLILHTTDTIQREQFIQRGEASGRTILANLEEQLTLGLPPSADTLQRLLQTKQRENPSLHYLLLKDRDGTILSHTLSSGAVPRFKDGDLLMPPPYHRSIPVTFETSRPTTEVVVGLNSQVLLEAASSLRAKTRLSPGTGALTGFSLGFFLLFVMLLSPIRTLATRARASSPASTPPPRNELSLIGHSYDALLKNLNQLNSTFSRDEADLQTQVRESTEELRNLNSRLLSDKTSAESIALLKSRILANMSHEIRTPMHGIIGMILLLMKSQLSEKQARYAAAVKDSAEGLLNVIDDILDFSKTDAGKLQLKSQTFNLNNLLSNLLSLLRTQSDPRGIALQLQIAPEVPEELIGDPHRLRQVLTNLIGNAIKFTPQGSITLTLSAVPLDDNSVELRFEVIDTGIGISPQKQSQIFDAFSQAGHPPDHPRGTGLGLAISRQLVKLMDGEINVESAPDVGSTFWFTIRVQRASLSPLSPPSPLSVNVPLQNPLGTPGPRVLLVEDNIVNQEVSLAILEELGYTPVLASNGEEAVSRVKEASSPFAAILMDCQMPVLDGYAATGLIRAFETGGPRTPIIAMTAHAMSGNREKTLEAGMDDYIPKPATLQQLHGVLTRWISPLSPLLTEPSTSSVNGGEKGHVDFEIIPGRRVRDLFCLTTFERLSRVEETFRARDLHACSEEAATLTRSAGAVGAHHMEALAREVSDAARAEDNLRIQAILPQLQQEFTHVNTELSTMAPRD